MSRGFETLKEGVILPKRATSGSAGYDFFLPEKVIIAPNQQVIIQTYIKAFMEKDEFLALFIRSSLGIKKGLRMMNQTGIVDSDYYNNNDNLGHILIALQNTSSITVTLEKNERFVQGVFMHFLTADGDNVETIRAGGIGSTNEK